MGCLLNVLISLMLDGERIEIYIGGEMHYVKYYCYNILYSGKVGWRGSLVNLYLLS